jgi:hypothetical protein
MNALVAIARREIEERWTILAAALALGFVPILALAVGAKADDIPAIATVVIMSLTFLVALLTGASVIGRDLAEGRLGFLFARPIPWWAIWGGKMAAALGLTLASAALATLPVAIWSLRARPVLEGAWSPKATVLLAAGAVLVVALAHNLSVAYRSRSPWILLDLAGAATLFAAMVAFADAAWVDWLYPPPVPILAALASVLAVPLLAAGAAQVAVGRIDPRRGYRALSVTCWAMVAPLALGTGAFMTYVQAASPRDLRAVDWAWPSPRGSWVIVTGPVDRGLTYRSQLIVDTATGRYANLGMWYGVYCTAFSSDGQRAAWSRERGTGGTDVFTMASGAAAPVRLASLSDRLLDCAVSPDGRRLAVVTRQAVTFFDTSASRPPLSVPVTIEGDVAAASYLGDRLRLLAVPRGGGGDPAIHEVTEAGARILGRLPDTPRPLWSAWSSTGDSLLVKEGWRPSLPVRVTLYEGSTGARLATLAESPRGAATDFDPALLADGRVVVVESGSTDARLRVFAPDGRELGVFVLGTDVAAAGFGSEITPGVIAVSLRRRTTPRSEIVVFDVDQHRVLRRETGLRAAQPGWFWTTARCLPGSPGCQLFVTEAGDLVRLDPATGERKVLLAARGR